MMRFVYYLFVVIVIGFKVIKLLLNRQHRQCPLDECIQDVYDEKDYQRWINYENDTDKSALIGCVVEFIMMSLLILSPLLNIISKSLPQDILVNSLLMIVMISIIETILSLIENAYDTFVIEEKYQMNTSTLSTFLFDEFKSLILSIVFNGIIIILAYYLYELFDYIGFIVLLLIVGSFVLFLQRHPLLLMKLFNQFTPLEEGPLRDKLTHLVEKYGFTLRQIYVMDASKRTKRANAFCCGNGKAKDICLDDNMIDMYSENEIVAVFAHEEGHAYLNHSDKLKWLGYLQGLILYLLFVFVMMNPWLYQDFGIETINYCMILLIVGWFIGPIDIILDLITGYYSRRYEYEADAFATKEGYGKDMISVLKKLSRDDLLNINPHPWVVKMSYSHPTLCMRIKAIEKVMQEVHE